MNSLFWQKHPALLYAICALIGTSAYLFWPSPWNLLFPLLWAIYLLFLRAYLPIFLIFAAALYSMCLYPAAPSGETGYFSISSLQPHQSPFQKGLLYKGMLYLGGQKVPCSIHHSLKDYPKADCDYIVQGHLIDRGAYNYLFKAKKWTPVERTWSLAEFRYQMKEKLRAFLEEKLTQPRTACFLGSLLTGDVENRFLRYEFSKLGLQHLLAISGFHFAILIAFCSFFLQLFLPFRAKIIALIIAINVYFIFVGSLPAVLRCYLAVSLFLVGKLIGRHSSPLNLLGSALLIEVILDPLISSNLGFQLSFTSCFGLLALSPYFSFPIKQSPFSLNLLSQHIYLLSSFFRKAFGLTLAVNLAILPLLLTHFHTFPMLSLIYNLFFPFLVSMAMFALLISLLTHLIFPPLATLFFQITDWFTAQLLDLTAYPPAALNYSLSVNSFPAFVIPFYLFLLFYLTNRACSDKILSFYGDRSSVG